MTPANDTLAPYKSRRDFTKTAEPSGKQRKAKAKALRFCVQKHDATRLHFDFRLELDGVLKSWAVTRGPSTDPADKRLAVRVEDHPFDYRTFEGTIPEGEYGGGTVMLWDEGTWEPLGDPHQGLEAGDLKFRLFGQRLKGEWVLVHMKGRDKQTRSGTRENWLLIKHHDDIATNGQGEHLVATELTSISTGRTMDQIASGEEPPKPRRARSKDTKPKTPAETPPPVAASPKARSKPSAAKPSPRTRGLALPAFRPPQLATLVDAVPVGRNWMFELKYDGYRCLAAISGDQVRLYTRNGNDWTDTFGNLVPSLQTLTRGTLLLDGEICAMKDGRTDFSTLKDALASGGPLTFFIFDLLEQDGKDLAALTQLERSQRLDQVLADLPEGSPLIRSTSVHEHGVDVFKNVCAAGLEGVIAKSAAAPYRGDRSRAWLKIKCLKRQEFVVGGWRKSEKKSTFASLLLGTWENGNLVYRGRVGTGWNDNDINELQPALDSLKSKDVPFSPAPPRVVMRDATWVRPELVVEVAYTEMTPDGYLRHPSFIGLRRDKPSRAIGLETPQPVGAVAGKEVKVNAEPGSIDLSDERGIAVAKREGVNLTHPDRVVFPGQGVTKAEIIAYYDAVAARMLPHVVNRPLSLVRCPQGRSKFCFFQKHASEGFPEQFEALPIREKDGTEDDYMYITNLAGLVAGVQMNALEFHIWGSRIADIERPDRIIFDIDPDVGLDFGDVKQAARDIRARLGDLGLETFPMVTGGKGIHVIAPLAPQTAWPEVKAFCKAFAQGLERDEPSRFVANMSKAKRKGRMFVDYLRNERGSTAVTPFSTRSREGAPCAVPVSWDEVPELQAANQFSLETAAARAAAPDPWEGYDALKQIIDAEKLKAVSAKAED